MVISHRYKFIFFCNGKTGTTSIQKALDYLDESSNMNHGAHYLWANKHMPPAVARAMLPARVWDNYFKFVFVRNPYDWAISHYEYSFRPKGRKQMILDTLAGRSSISSLLSGFKNQQKWLEKEYIDEDGILKLWQYLKLVRGLAGAESLMQKNYTQSIDGENIVDYVGKLETVDDDISNIADRIGVTVKLPHLNRTRTSAGGRLKLSDAARQKIKELWKEDFDLFGYSQIPR